MNAGLIRRWYEALERMGAAMFRRMDAAYSRAWSGPLRVLRRRSSNGGVAWPVTPGAYVVGDRGAPIAVCTLTSSALMRPIAALPGVAIAGRLYTSNLGIEKIIINVRANRRIRAILICGKESPLFRPAQGLGALAVHGVDSDRRIVGGEGYLPVLSGVSVDAVEQFRRQVVLIDRTGETEIEKIGDEVARLAREFKTTETSKKLPIDASIAGQSGVEDSRFIVLRPGGERQPLGYDPKGYFVITLDRDAGLVVAHHYLPNATPGHVMRGRSAEGMILALIREGLVTQLTHAAYLGAELEKGEAALRLGLDYEQDQPLRKPA